MWQVYLNQYLLALVVKTQCGPLWSHSGYPMWPWVGCLAWAQCRGVATGGGGGGPFWPTLKKVKIGQKSPLSPPPPTTLKLLAMPLQCVRLLVFAVAPHGLTNLGLAWVLVSFADTFCKKMKGWVKDAFKKNHYTLVWWCERSFLQFFPDCHFLSALGKELFCWAFLRPF